LPEPTATARSPLRTSITGTDWSFSVTSVTSLVKMPTLVSWPTTPVPSITGIPAAIAFVSPFVDHDLARERLRAV
jgi:hypothetical protein